LFLQTSGWATADPDAAALADPDAAALADPDAAALLLGLEVVPEVQALSANTALAATATSLRTFMNFLLLETHRPLSVDAGRSPCAESGSDTLTAAAAQSPNCGWLRNPAEDALPVNERSRGAEDSVANGRVRAARR
jgi:hypothetical protein